MKLANASRTFVTGSCDAARLHRHRQEHLQGYGQRGRCHAAFLVRVRSSRPPLPPPIHTDETLQSQQETGIGYALIGKKLTPLQTAHCMKPFDSPDP